MHKHSAARVQAVRNEFAALHKIFGDFRILVVVNINVQIVNSLALKVTRLVRGCVHYSLYSCRRILGRSLSAEEEAR